MNHHRSVLSLLSVVSWSLLVAVVLATDATGQQYSWHTSHTPFDGNHQYTFNSIDCVGDTCTASGAVIDPKLHEVGRVRLMMFRTTDGGMTWIEQDPGLPLERATSSPQLMQVQQIDAQNVVAVGDSGMIIRTFDGGVTWQKQQPAPGSIGFLMEVTAVHFANPLDGILIQRRLVDSINAACEIEITHDGGLHWTLAPFRPELLGSACHAYGGSRFRVVSYGQGPVYHTRDDWATVDSTPLVVPWEDFEHVVARFYFCGEDTVLGVGSSGAKLSESLRNVEMFDIYFLRVVVTVTIRSNSTDGRKRSLPVFRERVWISIRRDKATQVRSEFCLQ